VHSDATVPDQLEQLFQRACAELRRRLDEGQTAPAESVLRDFSTLSEIDQRAIAIIEREWQWRQARGEVLELDSFCRRFPRWQTLLSRRLRGNESSDDEQQGLSTVAENKQPDGSVAVEVTETLSEHDIHEKLGRGGMGEVYRAFDRILKRYVAIKLIRADLLPSNEDVQRFYREAQTAAQLRHRHIITVHRMGLHLGEHSFTMALASGGSLATRIADYREPRKAVELMVKIAAAVAHAHAQAIIHRDLKPANILFDENDEPLVTDFGLAKALGGSGELTIQGQVLGTPAYMSPEQAAGRTYEIGPSSDVWSLGVMLYEMLAGRKPYRGNSSDEILQSVMRGGHPALETVNAELDTGLVRIVARCLNRESAARYSDAGQLLADLQRLLTGESIPPAPAPKNPARPWLRVAVGGAVAATALAAAIIAALFYDAKPKTPETSTPFVDKQPHELVLPSEPTRGKGTIRAEKDGVRIQANPEAWVLFDVPTGWQSYQFSVELLPSNETTHAGIVWGYQERPLAVGSTFWYSRWVFAEQKQKRMYEDRERTSAWMWFSQHREITGTPKDNDEKTFGQVAQPFPSEPGRWRPMTLVISGGVVRTFWTDPNRPIKFLDQTEYQTVWESLFAMKPTINEPHPALWAGKFGIWVSNGSVLVRKAKVELIENK